MKLINRPILILRGENGFVCHHKSSNALDANRSVYDIFSLIFNDGAYHVKSQCDLSMCTSFEVSCLFIHSAHVSWFIWCFRLKNGPNIIHCCLLAGVNGLFWYVSSSGLVCSDGEKPEDFFLEFLEHGCVAIKGSNGKYLRGDKGGTLMGDAATVDASSLWEYWSLLSRVFKKQATRRVLLVLLLFTQMKRAGRVTFSCLFLY